MFDKCCDKENCNCKRTSQLINIALIFLSVFLISQALIGFQKLSSIGKEGYPQSTIVVSGTGDAFAIPDIATFSFSVTETAPTVKAAQDKATQKTNDALAVVKAAGVEDKDIQTTDYNVFPKYDYQNAICPQPLINSAVSSDSGVSSGVAIYCPPGKQTLTGYEVDQTIIVKVRKIETAGDLVTKIGTTGVSNISGVQFEVDNQEQFVAQAREKAITDAKAKAKELAKELGVRLGSVVSFNENGSYPIYNMALEKATGASVSSAPAPVQLPQGQTKITSDVSITYEIK